jgi:DNA-binding transcriptional LysR family regulator
MAGGGASLARAASAEAGAATGVVRITASEVVGVEVLPPMLAALQPDHPALVFELSLSNRSEDLLRREADIAIRMTRPMQEALVARRVGNMALGFHAHKPPAGRLGPPRTLEAAKALPLIGYETETIGVRAVKAMGLDLRREEFRLPRRQRPGPAGGDPGGRGDRRLPGGLAARDPMLERVLPTASPSTWRPSWSRMRTSATCAACGWCSTRWSRG